MHFVLLKINGGKKLIRQHKSLQLLNATFKGADIIFLH